MLQFLADECLNSDLLNIMGLMTTIVKILRYAIVGALILWGTIDMGKAVIAGDEKKIKEAQKPFVKRLVSAVIVFLIPYVISIVMGLVTTDTTYKDCWNAAWDNGYTQQSGDGTIK
jgi:hypothetical protein